MMFKKIGLMAVLLCAMAQAIAQQNVSLSNVGLVYPNPAHSTQDSTSLRAVVDFSNPVDKSRLIVLVGRDKDQADAGHFMCQIYQNNGQWLVASDMATILPDNKLLFPLDFIRDLKRAKYLTLYMEDGQGKMISQKLYYKMP